MFTKCEPIIIQQHEFMKKNNALKLTYCPSCKERWFDSEIKLGTSICTRGKINRVEYIDRGKIM